MSSPASGPPPYVSFRTFWNFLERLRRQGLPARVDRSLLGNYSGAVQGQLLTALKRLGLISARGLPAEPLRRLVEGGEEERRRALAECLLQSYAPLLRGLDLATLTSQQLRERLVEAGAGGDTVRRCLAFFVQAARQAGLPLSPYATSPRRRGRPGGRSQAPPSPDPPRLTRTLRLRSGGELTLSLNVDWFKLEEEDRQFVFSLIDRFRSYEGEGP